MGAPLFRGEFEVVKELTAALGDEGIDDAAQAFLKTKIMDNIQKYFYLIAFTAYLREMSEEGKGKLQWERDIPQEALDNLVSLASTDFHKNLGKIIHDIYLTGHNLFKDMPQGDHKKRAKYRFASKTLMRILPDNLKSEVESLINQKNITLDLYEILGQCTWGQAKSL